MQIGDTIYEQDTPKGRMVIKLGEHMGELVAAFSIGGKVYNSHGDRYGAVRKLAAPEKRGAITVTHEVKGFGVLTESTGAKVQAAFEAAVEAWRVSPEGQFRALRLERSQLETAWELAREAADEERREALSSTLKTGIARKPTDRKAEIEEARKALIAFDAAHPEIAAAVKEERARYIPSESID